MKPTDITGAIARVEGAVAQRVLVAVDGLELPAENAFGERVAVERGADVAALARRAGEAAAEGERVTLVARAVDLAAARPELARVASRGLGVVVHAIAEPAPPDAPVCESGIAPALSLGDLSWGMLFAAGPAEAVDLSLVARRAAEDSGCPFIVVHERGHGYDAEPVAAPSRELAEALLGGPRPPSPPPSATTERGFAERAPFALASAMRSLEGLTGRRHDVIERAPAADAQIVLVAAGVIGESLLAEVERQRAGGHDVAAVRVVAWRPFPAARLVKALCRALAIGVLEGIDRPLAANGPLAVQLKAAFADALTWAPGYPGIGRIPRIATGVVAARHELDPIDLDAVVHNLLADERGKRTFVVGADDASALAAPSPGGAQSQGFAMRGATSTRELATIGGDLCAAVLGSALGLRTRASVRAVAEEEGGGFAFDVLASRERPRGAHAPAGLRIVAIEDPAALVRGNPLRRLAPGGLVIVPSERRAADAVWADVPPWVKAIVFDRRARVAGWSRVEGEDPWARAAAFARVALLAAAADPALNSGGTLDAAVVAREIAEGFRALGHTSSEGTSDASNPPVEVPRATIEREDDAVRLGRRDSRFPAPAR